MSAPATEASERHFEAVEHPGDAESDDDERVEPPPRKPLEPCRDGGREQTPLFDAHRGGGSSVPRVFPLHCRYALSVEPMP